jgi:hypothetical protein
MRLWRRTLTHRYPHPRQDNKEVCGPKHPMVKKITNNGDVVYIYDSDPETVDAYHKDFQNYQKKLGRFVPLPLLMHIHDLD